MRGAGCRVPEVECHEYAKRPDFHRAALQRHTRLFVVVGLALRVMVRP